MGILSNIFAKIFPSGHPATDAGAAAASAGSGATAAAPGAAPTTQAGAPSAGTMQPVDVEAILDEKARQSAEKLNWRTSIVDLMKLLGLDSSFAHRKELATELHYSGDSNDSAAMNVWLHKQVMQQLAANGGKVPASLTA